MTVLVGKFGEPEAAIAITLDGPLTATGTMTARIQLPAHIVGVMGCPSCGGSVRRSKFGRPAGACYISDAKRGELICLRPRRLAEGSRRG